MCFCLSLDGFVNVGRFIYFLFSGPYAPFEPLWKILKALSEAGLLSQKARYMSYTNVQAVSDDGVYNQFLNRYWPTSNDKQWSCYPGYRLHSEQRNRAFSPSSRTRLRLTLPTSDPIRIHPPGLRNNWLSFSERSGSRTGWRNGDFLIYFCHFSTGRNLSAIRQQGHSYPRSQFRSHLRPLRSYMVYRPLISTSEILLT